MPPLVSNTGQVAIVMELPGAKAWVGECSAWSVVPIPYRLNLVCVDGVYPDRRMLTILCSNIENLCKVKCYKYKYY